MTQRNVIIGYSGSGKSTLAQTLGEKYHCEVLHLDCVHWLPGWQERDHTEQNAMISNFLDTHESWVIDGNYRATCYERRMNEATQIIFLDFPRHICLYRAIKRYISYRGKSRESMTEGCMEKIDLEFLWWILHKGRDQKHKKRYQYVCEKYAKKTVVLKNPRAVKKFLA
ncbi:MAG: DNA topology modulation protein [Eubacteriales bacterium]|nr:DNA topology modulation protein [Eubacteriales bacterium]